MVILSRVLTGKKNDVWRKNAELGLRNLSSSPRSAP